MFIWLPVLQLDDVNNVGHFVTLKYFGLKYAHQRESQFVEEAPAICKEIVEKVLHLFTRDDISKKSKYPVTGIHFECDANFLKMCK